MEKNHASIEVNSDSVKKRESQISSEKKLASSFNNYNSLDASTVDPSGAATPLQTSKEDRKDAIAIAETNQPPEGSEQPKRLANRLVTKRNSTIDPTVRELNSVDW